MQGKIKMTRRIKRKMEIFFKALGDSGGHVANACRACQMSRTQIYEWAKSFPEFEEQMNVIRDERIDNVDAALYKNALEGDTTAQIFYLKTIGKKRGYIERNENVIVDERVEVDFVKA